MAAHSYPSSSHLPPLCAGCWCWWHLASELGDRCWALAKDGLRAHQCSRDQRWSWTCSWQVRPAFTAEDISCQLVAAPKQAISWSLVWLWSCIVLSHATSHGTILTKVCRLPALLAARNGLPKIHLRTSIHFVPGLLSSNVELLALRLISQVSTTYS